LSVFLEIPEAAWVAANKLAFAFRDRFPVSRGHTLVVTRRVTSDWFSATADERAAILALVEVVKKQLDEELHPDGYNVGFNAGEAAGQTVMHLHVHVIPRFKGDMDDPRGGVRHVIPSRGNYLRVVAPLATGGQDDPFSRHVLPLFERADHIAIVAAFVQASGLGRIRGATELALRRGARIRIVTGDYLNITQADALTTLLDWEHASESDEDDDKGSLEARVIEVDKLAPRASSFHPKSWGFEAKSFGIAFVGSSNLSRSALETGIEWNLRVERDRDASAYTRIRESFEGLWERARKLDSEWIAAYARRAQRTQVPLPPGEVETEPVELPPPPHDVQREALAQLRAAREQGRRRAIVVLATGLGKTWLAAFDFAQLREEICRRPRVLFVAHRSELLKQAARTYRRQLRALDESARVGWFFGNTNELAADLVFASVAKLARSENLARLKAEHFDYVVIDEVHHAAADSYRRILDHVGDPHFVLGLTATPDRADAGDILGLFDDFVAYRADISRGIELGRLTPFQYFGVKDDIDYDNIPWRNRRFDAERLAEAAQTDARMHTLWRAWNEHRGSRTLVFCCSVAHADFVRAWLRARDVRVAAVYAADGSDDRETALAQLADGELDAVCAVDVFNEGVDVPSIDRVVMLRPTESSVVFLQQLGRGLRASEGKDAVRVIDFVGNHRVFLERLRALLSLGGNASTAALRECLASGDPVELPAGCSVDLELEAKELLSRLFRVGGADEVERVYRELCLERGTDEDPSQRPTAGELQRMGYLPSRLRERHGSWFEFVRGERGLLREEEEAFEIGAAFLREVETTEMTKCFKMVTLQVLIEAGRLVEGMSIVELAAGAHALLRRSPELVADVPDELREPPADDVARARWVAYWKKNPIAAWTGTRKDGRTWFRVERDALRLDLAIDPALSPMLAKLVRELVDYRLAQYRDRRAQSEPTLDGFVCKVFWNQRDPILKMPPRGVTPLPDGETDVRLPDGSIWQFRFMKEAVNVARPAGTTRNQLPDLLRGWFGPRAGQPGTAFQVRFHATPDGYWIQPVQSASIDVASRHEIVAYPDLRAAAGYALAAEEAPDKDLVVLPFESSGSDVFAVRVSGSSMDGGRDPLRDGDWAIMRVARSLPASSVENRVVLVEVEGSSFGAHYQIKRLTREGRGWRLTSDNPDGPSFDAHEGMTPIARLERSIHPEDLAPPRGSPIAEPELATTFSMPGLVPRSDRHSGHLFIFVDAKGQLVEPDRVRFDGVTARPSETAFVLAKRSDDQWQYVGIGRQTDTRGVWSIPDVDLGTWREWGEGREVSRRLPPGAQAKAQVAVQTLMELPDEQRWIVQPNGRRARITAAAKQGGLRIAGDEDGLKERTISLVDLAWVIVADDDVATSGGILDEQRVNLLRYLEGTPKGSTRWIDTGWAIAAWNVARSRVKASVATETVLHKVRKDDGSEIDASFRVERVGTAWTVVFESRGGTRGTSAERNSDYAEGLELILRRLGLARVDVDDIIVESRETDRLPLADRRIELGKPYPLRIADAAALRRRISAAQAKIGRAEGARGSGNQTKRLRLFLTFDGSARDLAALLARGEMT
jgi:superfamily II DNA or RNA helicase/diadenosine tetraphosphate (Ap4A) HIT family hydrolase/SOS-response transcriptional repressor LexA